MLTLPSFEFLSPKTLDEAASMLGRYPGAKILAGGTDLIPSMKNRLFEPSHLISLQNIETLKKIRYDEKNGLTLGALVTITTVASDPTIRRRYPVLSRAASKIATPLLQNKGTIGGNVMLDTRCYYYNQSKFWRQAINNCMKKDGDICRVAPGGSRCYAISSCDTVPVLYGLNASIRVVSSRGERTVALRDFYRNDGMEYHTLAPDEILAEIHVPVPPPGFRAAYMKLRRRQVIDYPMLGVMAGVVIDEHGICKDARIVLGAIFSSPFEVAEAEKVLIGKAIRTDDIEQAAQIAHDVAKPMDLTNFRPGYRKRMVRVFTRRLLDHLVNGTELIDIHGAA
jgi:4-hydroxybenzoyl-CoA reductase subunit beta